MEMTTRQLSVRLSVILAVIFITFLLIGGPADANSPPPPTAEYVVSAGDSLWSIASRVTLTGEDIRVVIADIKKASGLTTSVIHPGQVLLIPQG